MTTKQCIVEIREALHRGRWWTMDTADMQRIDAALASLDTLAAECLRLREDKERFRQAICKAVTMGSDGRLEISDEEAFVSALAQAQALDAAKEAK